ncbi:MAG TPA: tetratricopeptide repeat protein [Thermoanaerobaculia bacterium]|nr:tetratricopeptide repeat protein [Thermoanaerobaculia bacterium]
MSDLHPSRTELESFMLGRLSQQESRGVILHLLPGCPRCQEVTAAWWELGAHGHGASWPGGEQLCYDVPVDRVLDRVRATHAGLEAERLEARLRMAKLRTVAAARWPALILSDDRFHTWGFCELLLDQASVGGTMEGAELCAGLAVGVSDRIAGDAHPPRLLEELRARAWGELADARRRSGDLAGAEELLRRAELHLLRGTGDRLQRARLLERKAALRLAQERTEEAARLFGRAIHLYRRTGQADLVSRVLVRLGCIRVAAETRQAAEPAALTASVWLVDFLRGVRGVTARVVSRLSR